MTDWVLMMKGSAERYQPRAHVGAIHPYLWRRLGKPGQRIQTAPPGFQVHANRGPDNKGKPLLTGGGPCGLGFPLGPPLTVVGVADEMTLPWTR